MPGRTVKKEQEEISPIHVQRINLISVLPTVDDSSTLLFNTKVGKMNRR